MCLFNYSLQLGSFSGCALWNSRTSGQITIRYQCITAVASPLVNIGVSKIVSSTLHSQAAWPYVVGIAVSATMPSIPTSELVCSGNPQLCSTQIGSSNSIAPLSYVVRLNTDRKSFIFLCVAIFHGSQPNLPHNILRSRETQQCSYCKSMQIVN